MVFGQHPSLLASTSRTRNKSIRHPKYTLTTATRSEIVNPRTRPRSRIQVYSSSCALGDSRRTTRNYRTMHHDCYAPTFTFSTRLCFLLHLTRYPASVRDSSFSGIRQGRRYRTALFPGQHKGAIFVHGHPVTSATTQQRSMAFPHSPRRVSQGTSAMCSVSG